MVERGKNGEETGKKGKGKEERVEDREGIFEFFKVWRLFIKVFLVERYLSMYS